MSNKLKAICAVLLAVAFATAMACAITKETAKPSPLWAHDNLVAWTVAPFDAKQRAPEERAQMLERLGFKHYAYSWREKHISTFDAEIEALQRHKINLLAWWFPFMLDDTLAKQTLEIFKRHNVHPQLWVNRTPRRPEELAKWLPPGFKVPNAPGEYEKLSPAEKAAYAGAIANMDAHMTPVEQELRVKEVADHIHALVKLAAPYGSKIALYNHNGWFGLEENQLAIIDRLKELGVTDVGMVYNFSHARDELHDDSRHFPELWEKMKDHVVAVNITGMRWEGQIVYPSQGDSELEMMRVIERSGWKGPVGLIAEKGGDAEVTLRNYLVGLDWLAMELRREGSAGPRPKF